ncbi:MAG: oligosaccharide flippase family protein [Gammaproteobacteria bacterium]|nr:oligosaccharide flippase family protein [Gammaproteobacteria bacterium]
MIRRLPDTLRQTMLYGASVALMKGISLLMLPFIAHHLSTDAFGRLEVISSLAVIGSILVGMGLEDALFRFAGASKDPTERRRLAAEVFGLTLIIGTTALIVGYLSADLIAALMPGQPTGYEMRLVLSMLALEGCIAIPLGWLRMRNQAVSFFLVTIGRALTQALLVLLLLSVGRGVEGVLEAGLLAVVAQALVVGYLHIRDTGLSVSRKTGRRSLVYSLPIVASGLVAFALNGLDRWILAEHTGLADVAQFGVAAKFALAVVLLMQPFGMWWSPRRFEVLNEPDGHRKAAGFIALGVVLTMIIAVPVGLISPLLIDWMLPGSYAMAGQYTLVLVLVMAFKEIAELINLGCFTGKTTRTQLVINIIGASGGILGMFWWTPEHAVWGVILALLLAQGIRVVLFFIASQHFLPLPYPTRSLLLLATLGIGWLTLGSQAGSAAHQLLLTLAATGCLAGTALMLRLFPVPTRLLKR